MSLAILIPVFKNQAGLDRSLESLQESEGAFNVFIVDDGSPEPMKAPERLRPHIPVTVIRLDANHGIATALNHGVRHIVALGFDYIGRLDASDTVAPERFRKQKRFLDEDAQCAAVSSFIDFVDTNQRPLFRYRAPTVHAKIVRRLRVNNCMMHPGSMIRSRALRDVGLYREDVPGAEDYDLFLRLACNYRLAILPEVLTRMEYSPGGLSVAGRRLQLLTRLKLQLRYFERKSPYSFYGVLCTLFAMMIPHAVAFHLKRLCFR